MRGGQIDPSEKNYLQKPSLIYCRQYLQKERVQWIIPKATQDFEEIGSGILIQLNKTTQWLFLTI